MDEVSSTYKSLVTLCCDLLPPPKTNKNLPALKEMGKVAVSMVPEHVGLVHCSVSVSSMYLSLDQRGKPKGAEGRKREGRKTKAK